MSHKCHIDVVSPRVSLCRGHNAVQQGLYIYSTQRTQWTVNAFPCLLPCEIRLNVKYLCETMHDSVIVRAHSNFYSLPRVHNKGPHSRSSEMRRRSVRMEVPYLVGLRRQNPPELPNSSPKTAVRGPAARSCTVLEYYRLWTGLTLLNGFSFLVIFFFCILGRAVLSWLNCQLAFERTLI